MEDKNTNEQEQRKMNWKENLKNYIMTAENRKELDF